MDVVYENTLRRGYACQPLMVSCIHVHNPWLCELVCVMYILLWTTCGLTVLVGSLASAGRFCAVGRRICGYFHLTTTCMYFYTEITYVSYAASAIFYISFFLNKLPRFPTFLSHEAAIYFHTLSVYCPCNSVGGAPA